MFVKQINFFRYDQRKIRPMQASAGLLCNLIDQKIIVIQCKNNYLAEGECALII